MLQLDAETAEFWKGILAACPGLRVPECFQILLAYHGYNNQYSLSQLTEDLLKEIEDDARSRFDVEEAKYFMGHQGSNPKTFKILGGFRKAIFGAVAVCQKKKFLGVDVNLSKSNQKSSPNPTATPNSTDKGLKLEEDAVRRLIITGVKTVESELVEGADKLDGVKIKVRLDGGLLRAEITCHLCSQTVSFLKNNRNTWVVSNFITHMKKMHPDEETAEERKKAKTALKSAKRSQSSSPLAALFQKAAKRKLASTPSGTGLFTFIYITITNLISTYLFAFCLFCFQAKSLFLTKRTMYLPLL